MYCYASDACFQATMGRYSMESPRVANKSDVEIDGIYTKANDDTGSSHGSSSGGSSDDAQAEVVKSAMVGVGEVVSVQIYFVKPFHNNLN